MTPLGRWAGILLVAMLPFFTSGCGAGIAGLILLLTGSSSS